MLRSFIPVVLGASLFSAAVTEAAPVPDPVTLDALRAELAQAKVIRVTGATGPQMLRDVRLDSTGVSSARWGSGAATRPALFASQDVMPPPAPRPIAWSEISRIESGTTNVPLAALKGLVVGGLLGWAFWATVPTGEDGGQGPAGVIIGVPAIVGAGIGAWLGSARYHWRTVFPRAAAGGAE
jgi:hypothetical protein